MPNSLTLIPSCSTDFISDFISTCRGETAIGKGSKLPLVISTSIKAYKEINAFNWRNKPDGGL